MTSVTFLSSKLEETGCPRRPMRRLPETVVTVTDLVKLPGMPEIEDRHREQLARWMTANDIFFGMPIPVEEAKAPPPEQVLATPASPEPTNAGSESNPVPSLPESFKALFEALCGVTHPDSRCMGARAATLILHATLEASLITTTRAEAEALFAKALRAYPAQMSHEQVLSRGRDMLPVGHLLYLATED